jgi:hypothetical protein
LLSLLVWQRRTFLGASEVEWIKVRGKDIDMAAA